MTVYYTDHIYVVVLGYKETNTIVNSFTISVKWWP